MERGWYNFIRQDLWTSECSQYLDIVGSTSLGPDYYAVEFKAAPSMDDEEAYDAYEDFWDANGWRIRYAYYQWSGCTDIGQLPG